MAKNAKKRVLEITRCVIQYRKTVVQSNADFPKQIFTNKGPPKASKTLFLLTASNNMTVGTFQSGQQIQFEEYRMKAIALSRSSIPKRIALTMFVLTTILVGTSMESNAQLFRRSRAVTSGFNSSSFRTAPAVKTSNYRIPKPVTGYGANLHRNFVIRQQQQRSRAGGSLIYRGNILWRY